MNNADIKRSSNLIIAELRSRRNQKNIDGMARFGINSKNILGVSAPHLKDFARRIKRNAKKENDAYGYRHSLALELWRSEIHEARILAALIDEKEFVSEDQMEKWVMDFDSWGICDKVCGDLFDKTEFAYKKAIEWSARKEEYVKRAGFVLMATLAVHDKSAGDNEFLKFFPYIKKGSVDERNFVKKAVNWALRQIGKRNKSLKAGALQLAKKIKKLDSRSAKWIASDAIRELKKKKNK